MSVQKTYWSFRRAVGAGVRTPFYRAWPHRVCQSHSWARERVPAPINLVPALLDSMWMRSTRPLAAITDRWILRGYFVRIADGTGLWLGSLEIGGQFRPSCSLIRGSRDRYGRSLLAGLWATQRIQRRKVAACSWGFRGGGSTDRRAAVVLEPGVAKAFPNAGAVNEALRALAETIDKYQPRRTRPRRGSRRGGRPCRRGLLTDSSTPRRSGPVARSSCGINLPGRAYDLRNRIPDSSN